MHYRKDLLCFKYLIEHKSRWKYYERKLSTQLQTILISIKLIEVCKQLTLSFQNLILYQGNKIQNIFKVPTRNRISSYGCIRRSNIFYTT